MRTELKLVEAVVDEMYRSTSVRRTVVQCQWCSKCYQTGKTVKLHTN